MRTSHDKASSAAARSAAPFFSPLLSIRARPSAGRRNHAGVRIMSAAAAAGEARMRASKERAAEETLDARGSPPPHPCARTHAHTAACLPASTPAADGPPAILPNANPTQQVLESWRAADAVCFDVDSTFCEDESIDELAAFLGVGEAVAALTARAMGGTVLFQDALAARLDLMRPSKEKLERFLEEHPARLSPGIPELVKELQRRNKHVFLVSGGFRAVIAPIAASLGIPAENVYANQILFDVELCRGLFVAGSAARALSLSLCARASTRNHNTQPSTTPPPPALPSPTPHKKPSQPPNLPHTALRRVRRL
jgi:HAD superfamily phosphoserine phosphatase-like hydrolase